MTSDPCSTKGMSPKESFLWCLECACVVLGAVMSSLSFSDWEGGRGRDVAGALCTKRGAPNGSGLHTGGIPWSPTWMTSLVTSLVNADTGWSEKASPKRLLGCGGCGFD